MASRFEVRLDKECRERLDELAESKGVTAAEIVRQLIYDAHENVLQERRVRAAKELIAMNAEVPPDPAELSRLLETLMTLVSFVDTNVPIYADRQDHPYKEPCASRRSVLGYVLIDLKLQQSKLSESGFYSPSAGR